MAVALKNLPDLEPDTPAYTDRLIAWHNQRLWYVACGLGGLLALSFAINLKHEYQPPAPPYVLEVNGQGQPVGQVLPILSVQAIPDAILKAQLGDFIHDAFTISHDPDEEDRLFAKTQSRVTGAAAHTLDQWYQRDGGKHHPKAIFRYTSAEALPQDVLKLDGSDRYQIDYKVKTHENNDQTETASTWRAVLHVIVGRSVDPESPGWFVNEIDFQEIK